jgi:hypothetical protein
MRVFPASGSDLDALLTGQKLFQLPVQRSTPELLRDVQSVTSLSLKCHALDEPSSARAVPVIPIGVQKEQALTIVHPRTIRTPPHKSHRFLKHKPYPTASSLMTMSTLGAVSPEGSKVKEELRKIENTVVQWP